MNFKTTIAIFVGIFTIVAIGVLLLVFNNKSKESEIENFKQMENTTTAEDMEDTGNQFRNPFVVIDAPTAPLSCAKGMRYDDVSNKCKRVI